MPTDEEKTVNGIRFTPMEYSMEMIVETERIFLREMNMGDYDALYQVLADPDRILPEIGYHIRCDCRCKGYAKEAAKAVMDWAFRNTDFPALYSYRKYINEASIRTAESIGIQFDREYTDEANGMTHVSVIYRRDMIVTDYIAYCGLDCETCEARLATVGNDNELRIKISKEWSGLNGVEITPEMINCSGCRIPGVKTVYCESLCPIRQCAREKQVETCGSCPEMKLCEKVGAIIGNNPEARGRLENAGSV